MNSGFDSFVVTESKSTCHCGMPLAVEARGCTNKECSNYFLKCWQSKFVHIPAPISIEEAMRTREVK